MKRKWLRILFLIMLAGVTCFGVVNPKDIEETLQIMNETKVEFTIPDECDKGDGGPDGYRSLVKIDVAETADSPPEEQERSGGNTLRG
ncbi:MAG: hypothetical protein WA185_11025 [Candidatus Acidiferrales bacterium]